MQMTKYLFMVLLLIKVACTPIDVPALTEVATVNPTPTQETWTEVPTVVPKPCSRYSYNINGTETPNRYGLVQHLVRLNPCYVLVMEGLSWAGGFNTDPSIGDLQLSGMLPNTRIIHRDWSRAEGGEWTENSPDILVNRWVNQGYPHLIRYSTNEPSVGDHNIVAFLAYEEELMRVARSRGITVSVGNFGVGRIQPHWVNEGLFDNWLRSVIVYNHIIGNHEYTLGILPFGVGQWPASYLLDRTEVQPSKWPTALDLPTSRIEYPVHAQGSLIPFGIEQFNIYEYARGTTITHTDSMILPPYWHLRRGDWLLIRADELGIQRPTLVLTEAFWDNMDDVAAQRNVMRDRYGIDRYMNDMRGINSLQDYWHYLWPTWSPAYAACRQLQWAEETYPDDYASFNLFTWSSSQGWISFDVSGRQNGWNFELQEMMEKGMCD